MGTKTKKKLSDEQIKAIEERNEKLKNFAKIVSEMTPEQQEELRSKINIVNTEKHVLSARNCIMLDQQAKERNIIITMVGGFDQWRAVNRQVKKGSKAFYMVAPSTYKVKSDNGSEETKNGFRTIAIFDISQTEEIQENVSEKTEEVV